MVKGVLGLRFGLCFLSVHLSGPKGGGFSVPFSEKNKSTNERTHQLINLLLLNGCGCNIGQTVRLRENFKFAKLIPPLHSHT